LAAWKKARPDEDPERLEGAAASEEALGKRPHPRLLYVITHGFFFPDLKHVRAGGANRWRERAAQGKSDGLLTALEAQNLDLWGTELVVLSACETGLGEVQVGEGVMGLRRSFQNAGAQTVLASVWPVPDKETARLMDKFFRNWLGGMGKAEALRAAQRELIAELRAQSDPRHKEAPPLYWAGFICHGQAR